MKNHKILTDFKISQSPVWVKNTTYVGDISPKLSSLFSKIFKRSYGKLKPFFDLIVILISFRKYEVIVTGNVITGQMFALVRRIFHLRIKHIILELMLDEESKSIVWKFKRKIQKYLLFSVDIIFVSSSYEIEPYAKRFQLSESKFRFLHFHTNIITPKMISNSNGYILCAGKTGRDYQTLCEAVKGLPIEVVIVSDYQGIKGISVPENVRVHVNVPRERYIELLENCSMVIVPLHELIKSTGQVVILEAMALGKPVIATNAVGIRDYIIPGQTGVLVPPRDPDSLRNEIINLYNNTTLQNRISENALKFIVNNCTVDIYFTKILYVAGLLVAS